MSTDGRTDGRTDEPKTIAPFDLRRGTKNPEEILVVCLSPEMCTRAFNRLIESMMGLKPRQGNLRLLFRLFSLMRGLLSTRLK